MRARNPVDGAEGRRGGGLVALDGDRVAVGPGELAGIEEDVGRGGWRSQHVDLDGGAELLVEDAVVVGEVGVLGHEELEAEGVVQVGPLVGPDPVLEVDAAEVAGTQVLAAEVVEEDDPVAALQRAVETGIEGETAGEGGQPAAPDLDRMVEVLLELGPVPEDPVLDVDGLVVVGQRRDEDREQHHAGGGGDARLPEVPARVGAEAQPALDGPQERGAVVGPEQQRDRQQEEVEGVRVLLVPRVEDVGGEDRGAREDAQDRLAPAQRAPRQPAADEPEDGAAEEEEEGGVHGLCAAGDRS